MVNQAQVDKINRTGKVAMVCQECGKTKAVSPDAKLEPRCSCGSVDLEVA
jgi:hypothetical protein